MLVKTTVAAGAHPISLRCFHAHERRAAVALPHASIERETFSGTKGDILSRNCRSAQGRFQWPI
jgi:hypothetical protein